MTIRFQCKDISLIITFRACLSISANCPTSEIRFSFDSAGGLGSVDAPDLS